MTPKPHAPTVVKVTATQIRDGIAGDCQRCAVAMALIAATGDEDAMVAELDWTLRIGLWGRWIVAPRAVRDFVYGIDGLGRDSDHRPKLPEKLAGTEFAPFDFRLPPIDNSAWEGQCYGCEELSDPGELDDDGYCDECRKNKE